MNQRPNSGEDEEDLLKFQREFLASGAASGRSVSVKRPEKRKTATGEGQATDVVKTEDMETEPPVSQASVPVKRSKFNTRSENGVRGQSCPGISRPVGEEEDVEEMIDGRDTGLAAVLSTIIERDTHHHVYTAPQLGTLAFPAVLRADGIGQGRAESGDNTAAGPSRGRKKSLFAQHMESQGVPRFGGERQEVPRFGVDLGVAARRSVQETESVIGGGGRHGDTGVPRSSIVDGRGLSISDGPSEAQNIHRENLGKLTAMSEAEILEERQKLLDTIDPQLVQYLRNKRRAAGGRPGETGEATETG
ncbi:RNA polymerase II-associated protein 1, partial [Aplysia californica]|uniref:RNA polymerase II-associated protein 1 n=1 Tax=Aplysia californica TaxID=6500 RepID=A0ABM0K4H5_APLCA